MRRRAHFTIHQLFHLHHHNNYRPRILHHASLFKLSALVCAVGLSIQLLTALPTQSGAVLGIISTITPNQVISQTNGARAEAGVPPLESNDQLTQAAVAKAQDMLQDQYWAHIAPDGTEPWAFIEAAGYRYSTAGENLGRDFTQTESLIQAWLASPTHRDNLLHPKYSDIGVAVVDGFLDGAQTSLVIQLFGHPLELAGSEARPRPQQLLPQEAVVTTVQAESDQNVPTASPTVLSEVISVAAPSRMHAGAAYFSSTHILKAFLLAVILLLSASLIYDLYLSHSWKLSRLVSKNLAHLAFLFAIALLVLYTQTGVVG